MQNQIPSMKRGICPACGSNDVHAGTEITFKTGASGSNTIPINIFRTATLDNYVCVNCGYVESYVNDLKARESIAKNWPKAGQLDQSIDLRIQREIRE